MCTTEENTRIPPLFGPWCVPCDVLICSFLPTMVPVSSLWFVFAFVDVSGYVSFSLVCRSPSSCSAFSAEIPGSRGDLDGATLGIMLIQCFVPQRVVPLPFLRRPNNGRVAPHVLVGDHVDRRVDPEAILT